MRRVFWVLTAALLCACSQQGAGEVGTRTRTAHQRSVQTASAIGAMSAKPFAGLPDRGELVRYSPPVRGSGAYTWHAAKLSEAHAINAIVTGRMTLTAPDGTPITLRYDHHIEHPNGNWSWIGTTATGEQALITFGATAAFGSIPQGRGLLPLRLTTADGIAWVVSTDRRQLAAVRSDATDPSAPDYFVPPPFGAGSAAQADVGMGTAAAAPMATMTGTNQVDLLVGYTPGYAAALGGEAAARTRIQFLVDITNEAYANSQVDARVRLIQAMQVNYPDATDNRTALEEMTGFVVPSTRTEPDPAFSALRAARDRYGADLVTMVRKFQTPENGGCGIAWLIGGGQSGITASDEYFGYSVVSDGQDASTGGTYYCRDETLAHELGHNMGSQHDAVTANNQRGAYPYSFGYKTSVSAGNFHTVMAYGDSGQTSYRVFSNPQSAFCGGRVCGSSTADNARSLRQTIPIIAGFRASTAPVASLPPRNDIDGDGRTDLLWYRPSDGLLAYWIMNGTSVSRHGAVSVGGAWRIIATGDFDGDGKLDLIWNRPQGDMQFWRGDGQHFSQRQYFARYPDGWVVAAVGDIDGDGNSDLLWRRSADGLLAYWIMDGATIVRHGSIAVGNSWNILAADDFNGDGKMDLVWNRAQGDMQFWHGDGAEFAQRRYLAQYPSGWKLVETVDVDGDERVDLVWYRPSSRSVAYWIMNGPIIERHGAAYAEAGAKMLLGGDLEGDGKSDLLWLLPSGNMYCWLGDAEAFATRRSMGAYPSDWLLISERG